MTGRAALAAKWAPGAQLQRLPGEPSWGGAAMHGATLVTAGPPFGSRSQALSPQWLIPSTVEERENAEKPVFS